MKIVNKERACILFSGRKEGPVAHDDTELLTVSEVAKRLRVDDTTVRRWIKSGVLDAIPLPHHGVRQAYRIRRSTLEALLSSPAITSSDSD